VISERASNSVQTPSLLQFGSDLTKYFLIFNGVDIEVTGRFEVGIVSLFGVYHLFNLKYPPSAAPIFQTLQYLFGVETKTVPSVPTMIAKEIQGLIPE
jgi:hypothetical protein